MSGRVRPGLTREAVLAAAVELADRDGLAALSMRSLARHLGVEAMSLYHHVANKEALLDGMVDAVFAEIHAPTAAGDWRVEMAARHHSARAALTGHRWAVGLMDSRSSPGPATLRHHDAVIGCLRAGGFSIAMSAHAFAVLDSHLYGFLVQEVSLPFDEGDDMGAVAEDILGDVPMDGLPHLTEMAVEHVMQPGYAFADEFDWGLELILDGLERRRTTDG
ncbi:TetR family transcriptional regulator [Nocardioides guangzhouensis]|uniref:TetR family transcriptional regulator n=1 Tax=Nocardioides guangzhouensis TaxID=2497878 RepID=A0A4Q4ZJ74_9ACTN|nr:TetR/AcrR family transcriptional regulator C-terminal domain-containing protein [Nocardioides guangzhouensis]RYP88347.1 TetR family transcriptional regulator [Nocardioides guangzhouensis]